MQKGKTILVMALVFVVGLASCTGNNDKDKFRKGWTLLWDDDFDGTELSGWSKIPRGKQLMDRHMSNNEALYFFENGNLVLRGMENAADNAEVLFLTGGITREGMKRDSVSRIEVRARMNPVAGAIPFITLLPTDGAGNISIDIMERYGYDKFVYQSLSSEYTTTEGMADNPPSNVLVGVNPNQYHIYGVERYPDSLVFFVDDIRTKNYSRILTDIPGQFPFNDLDFDLFIGIMLNRNTDPEELPADMLIDWVRYYKLEVAGREE